MEYEVKYYWDSIDGSSEVIVKKEYEDGDFEIIKMTLDEIYKYKELEEDYHFLIQGYDLDKKEMVFTRIKEIINHNEQEVFNILTKGELEINTTNNHFFITYDSHTKEDIICELKYFEINDPIAVESSYTNINKDESSRVYDTIACIKHNGRAEVFTIELDGPCHTYFVNGFLASDQKLEIGE